MTDMSVARVRTALAPQEQPRGEVTLINSFTVPPGRDEAFLALFGGTSGVFATRPGFASLRLHRAVSPNAPVRFVNVARWASLAAFQQAHATPEFAREISQAPWREFPSTPALYEVVVEC